MGVGWVTMGLVITIGWVTGTVGWTTTGVGWVTIGFGITIGWVTGTVGWTTTGVGTDTWGFGVTGVEGATGAIGTITTGFGVVTGCWLDILSTLIVFIETVIKSKMKVILKVVALQLVYTKTK